MKSIPTFSTDAIRVESPGENFAVEQLLIEKGGGPPGILEENGRIRFQIPWFQGLKASLLDIERQNSRIPFMNYPTEIVTMFDKPAAQQHLFEAGLPIPEFICEVESFDRLIAELKNKNIHRVFLKPAHSSSASGVIALQIGKGDRMLATAPAILKKTDQNSYPHIYNSLRIRQYSDRNEIKLIVDTLVPERIFAERWFPKASLNGRTFDLRVLVIAGKSSHVVVRTSRTPITNLHLGNHRGKTSDLKRRLGPEMWEEAMHTCELAAKAFSKCHYVAVDLMVGTAYDRFAIAEVNAFGDLIPNVLFNGEDTYTSEISSFTIQSQRRKAV